MGSRLAALPLRGDPHLFPAAPLIALAPTLRLRPPSPQLLRPFAQQLDSMSRAESTRQLKRQRSERPSHFQQQQQEEPQQQQEEEEEGALHGAATAIDRLTRLSQELLICVLKYLEDYSDCAKFSLATPRLGLTALQNRLQLPRFQHPLFAVAMRLITMDTGGREGMRSSTLAQRAEARARSMTTPGAHSRFAEAWLRKYVAGYAAASPDDFEWIKASSPELHIAQGKLLFWQQWHLVRGGVPDAIVRREFANGSLCYYEGEQGAERAVRAKLADGTVQYFEGEQDAERLIRAEFADGFVQYFEGEQNVERAVRAEFVNGTVQYFKGEHGAERLIRAELADGTAQYFEGEPHAERVIRADEADGSVQYYEGEYHAERLVRTELADGTVQYFEGEPHAERLIRTEEADGTVQYYEGEHGAEPVHRLRRA
jgi:hypothetical protein